jgi:acid stress-induced BolA-like protein IbaG/YrbA
MPLPEMVTPESIRHDIERGMTATLVDVEGDGHHFEAIIVSAEFSGKNRVQRHQRVYRALGDRMRDEIHALSMKTYTPEEWESSR